MRITAGSLAHFAVLTCLAIGCGSWNSQGTAPARPGVDAPIIVGQPAPEIEGEDVDGVAFKLSDYRGKVVMLDFWGNW